MRKPRILMLKFKLRHKQSYLAICIWKWISWWIYKVSTHFNFLDKWVFSFCSLHLNRCKNCELLWVLFIPFKFSRNHPEIWLAFAGMLCKTTCALGKATGSSIQTWCSTWRYISLVHISNCSPPWFMTPFQCCSKPSTQHERWACPKHAYTKWHLHNNRQASQKVGSFPLNVSACSAIILHPSITKKKGQQEWLLTSTHDTQNWS